MKKLATLVMAVALLTACVGNAELKKIAVGEPILPIHYQGDTMTVYLTDYLPSVDLSKVGNYAVDNGYELVGITTDSLRLCGTGDNVGLLHVGNNRKGVVIPILPKGKAAATVDATYNYNDNVILHSKEPVSLVGLVQNTLVRHIQASEDSTTFTLDIHKIPQIKGRSYLRFYAWNEHGLQADMLFPLQDGLPVTFSGQLNRHDPQAQVLYSILIDRFYNGNPDNDAPLNRPDVDPRVDYQGGDLAGITQKIESGFFNDLGINTIWISPITQNPTDAWGQYHDPDTRFSGYHGYWPIFNTKIDDRMGTDEELRKLLATAHEHQINVILDYVANHMHINSPTLQAHPDWITDSILPDGRRNFELWDEARLTTWFDKHIPTLDLEREEVCDAMTDTALYWIENYDFDGYRHDACKHIPLNYWRMFTRKMKTRYPDRALWMIGETYGNSELIGSYVKSGMLNAQFDFNIYHTAIDVFGKEGQSMKSLANTINESLSAYGMHHTMGNISGNHDKTRFISLAGGAVSWDEDDKAAGWHRDIGVTADGDPDKEFDAYRKALLLEALNFTIPGVPCIYQGDEYGQCGANDPDNRRMMRFDGYSKYETLFRKLVSELCIVRRNNMPLLYGDYKQEYVDDDVLAFSRTYLDRTVMVALNKSDKYVTVPVNVRGTSLRVTPYGYTIILDSNTSNPLYIWD